MRRKIGAINYIWAGLFTAGILYAAFTGNITAVTETAIASAGHAVEICIGLAGVMCLWMGILKIAEAAGALRLLAKAMRPLMARLFPEVPPEHPAMGAMVLNMSANMLGLGNAATPLGLKAMAELDRLNPHPGEATDAMVLFLAINTSSVTLVPATVIALRAAAGSAAPAEVIGPILLSSTASTLSAIILCKLFSGWERSRRP